MVANVCEVQKALRRLEDARQKMSIFMRFPETNNLYINEVWVMTTMPEHGVIRALMLGMLNREIAEAEKAFQAACAGTPDKTDIPAQPPEL